MNVQGFEIKERKKFRLSDRVKGFSGIKIQIRKCLQSNSTAEWQIQNKKGK
jgi:hypothetical protein